MSLKNKSEEDWFTNACGALATIEEEDNVAAQEDYAKAYSLLSKRLTTAESHDSEGRLQSQMETAKALAAEEKYADALEAIEVAGEIATELISKAPKKGVVTDLKSGDVKPLVGKEKGTKYVDEQYQEDELGNVKHGGEFRGASKIRTHYASDEEKDKSAMRVNEEGKLVDTDGDTIDGEMGYAVDAEKGTAHTFDPTATLPEKQEHKLFNHHTTPLQGKKAAAAGIQKVEDGVVRKINTESGHYRPEPEMTHQYVEGLKEQGVQMRDKKMMMFDENGEAVKIDGNTMRELDMVESYEKSRADNGDQRPYDPRYQEIKDKLQKKGVGPSERDATVEVFDKRSVINEEDWTKIKGDVGKIEKFIEGKIGKPLSQVSINFGIKDPNNLIECNDTLGKYLRMGEGKADAGRVTMKAEQFAQTGGNMDAVDVKKQATAQIQQRHIDKLGGAAKLKEMGVEDPSKLPMAKQIAILEGTEPVPKAEEVKPVKKRRGALEGDFPGSEAKREEPPIPKSSPPPSKPLTQEDKAQGHSEDTESEDEEKPKAQKKPTLERIPLSEEDKAKGYSEDTESEDEEKPKAQKKPTLERIPLSEEDKAKGYSEDTESEDEEKPKAQKKPTLERIPLSEEDKAKGYSEDTESEDEEKPKAQKKPTLESKPLSEEDKAKGYTEGPQSETEVKPPPPKPKLEPKPLTEEDKAKGYTEGPQSETEVKPPPPKPKLEAKPLTEEDKAKGYTEGPQSETEVKPPPPKPKLEPKPLTEEDKAKGYTEGPQSETEVKPPPPKPKLEAKPLTEEDKAKGYTEGPQSETEVKPPPPKPKLEPKPLTEEDKAKGYTEGPQSETEVKPPPPKPKLEAKPLTEEDKAKGYTEGPQSETEVKPPPPKPKLEPKPLTEEDKAKGYTEGTESETEEKPQAPKKPKLESKPLSEEDKAKGYTEGTESESKEKPQPPKKTKLPTVSDDDPTSGGTGYSTPVLKGSGPKSSGSEEPQEEPEPPKPKAMNIGEIKKPTSAPIDPLQGKYDDKGGDEALLQKELGAWKKRNAKTMSTLREMEKRRKEAMSTFEKSQSEEDKAKLKEITEGMASFKKDMDIKDAIPTKARLAKLPVAERLKRLD